MSHAVQFELRLAKRMARLGTETAFEVLNRARELERNGKDIIPGDSAKSPLVAMVSHAGDPDDFMPPKKAEQRNPPLTKDQIGLIRAWIDQGAK